MRISCLILFTLLSVSCSKLSTSRSNSKNLVLTDRKFVERLEKLNPSSAVSVVVRWDGDKKSLVKSAKANHVAFTGELDSEIITLTGNPQDLLKVEWEDYKVINRDHEITSPVAMLDEVLPVVLPTGENIPPPLDTNHLFMARSDFGIDTYLKENPTHDGRNVIVGIVDDGISPVHPGLNTTSDGQRKFLYHGTVFSLLKIEVEKSGTDQLANSGFIQSVNKLFPMGVGFYTAQIYENRPTFRSKFEETKFDLNADENFDSIDVALIELEGGLEKICADFNVDKVAAPEECFGYFSASGEFGYWNKSKGLATVAEPSTVSLATPPAPSSPTPNADAAPSPKKAILLTQGEREDDSHAEGVASVIAGNKIGGKFNGIAPGAKLMDFDLYEFTNRPTEAFMTVGSYLQGLEQLASRGADIINISLMTFADSADTQKFMAEAIDALVKKYQFIITFAAGNDGTSLNTVYERGNFPRSAIFVGAYINSVQNEHVHGVTGESRPGKVIWYSSQGPGLDGRNIVDVISPLATLTYNAPTKSYDGLSGTSSAAPAIAGFAAVLLSAVKEKGLPFEANTLVAAIRLSGKPLDNVPYITQGFGIPDIRKAIKLYEEIISKRQFTFVKSVSNLHSGPDGTEIDGAFFKTSQDDFRMNYELTLKVSAETSELPESLSPATTPPHVTLGGEPLKDTLLKEVQIEYSHPFIKGPRGLWLAHATSKFYASVDLAEAAKDSSFLKSKELFAEIVLRDMHTKLILHRIPITIIDDQPLVNERTETVQLSSDSGTRLHFHNTFAGQAVLAQIEVDNPGTKDNLVFRMTDPSGDNMGFWWGTGQTTKKKKLIVLRQRGWYQVNLSRWGGTVAPITAKITIRPINIELMQHLFSKKSAEFTVMNGGGLEEGFSISLRSQPHLLDQKLHSFTQDGVALKNYVTHSVKAEKQGNYWFEFQPASENELSVLQGVYLLSIYDKEGKLVRSMAGWNTSTRDTKKDAINIDEKEVGYTIEYVYLDFLSLFDKAPGLQFLTKSWYQEGKLQDLPANPVTLLPGKNKCTLPKLYTKFLVDQSAVGDGLEVVLHPGVDSADGELILGTMTVME